MQSTLEIDRRTQRRHDTGLASTYQLDHVRRDFGFRAILVATPDGEMLLGSMDEPLGRPLARAVSCVGAGTPDAREALTSLRDDHLGGDRGAALHVTELELDGHLTYLGILAATGQELGDAIERTTTGLQRIFANT